jgi:hypothetical protein
MESPVRFFCLVLLLAVVGGVSGFAQNGGQKAPLQKAPIQGLVTMGDIRIISDPTMPAEDATAEATAHPGVYAAVVLVERWSHLEPERGKFDDADIEKGLGQIRAYNAKYPKTPVVGKLRVFGGPNAPAWAKAIDGGPIDLSKKGRTMVVGKFWTAGYTEAWRELQAALAAKYDDNPLVQEVAISSCGSTSAEPFVMSMLTENIPVFQKAGFTDDAMMACLMNAPEDYAGWKHAALDYTFNGYRTYGPDGKWILRPEFTVKVMDAFREKYGARAVVANHGLNDEVSPVLVPIVAEMKRLGPPMEFQTANWKGHVSGEVAAAKGYGATEFEMWNTKDTGQGVGIGYEEIKGWLTLFPYTDMVGLGIRD